MDANLVRIAAERIAKARSELILSRTFYGVLVSQVTPVPSDEFPTMATNGKQHFFNPAFIAELTQTELLGVQAHESEHDARRHHTRRGGRDPVKWNEACDYAINPDVIDEGFKLPKGALLDRRFKGMSAEDIYRTLEIEKALEQPKPEDEPESEQGDEDESDDADTDESNGDEAGDDEGEDGDDEGKGEGPADDGNEDTDGGQGNGDAEDGTEGEGTGKGTGSADGDADGEPGEGEPQKSSGDPGRCGEVVDAAEDVAELADEDAKWERVTRQAAMLAAKRGDAPGHVAREIERSDHPPQDWRETLRAYFDGGATVSETWNRPNRRLVGQGIYMPGHQRDGVNRVVFMIDTSGSVTYYPGALEAIKVETQAALDEGIIDQAVVLYGDTQVTRVDEYRNGDEIEFDPRGGGGTVMAPLFKYVADEVDDASLIVAFTDLEIEPESELGPEPHCPVLWAAVGYPANVKQYLAATPWGAPGIEVRPDV